RSPPGGAARLSRPGGRAAAFSGTRHVAVQRPRAVQLVLVLYDFAAAPAPAPVAGGKGVGVRAAIGGRGGKGRQVAASAAGPSRGFSRDSWATLGCVHRPPPQQAIIASGGGGPQVRRGPMPFRAL